MIAQVEKIRLIVPKNKKEKALEIISSLECIDFEEKIKNLKPKEEIQKLSRAIKIIKFINSQNKNQPKDFKNKEKLHYSKILELTEKYNNLKNSCQKLKLKIDSLYPYKDINISKKDIEFENFEVFIGESELNTFEKYRKIISKKAKIFIISKNKKSLIFLLIFKKGLSKFKEFLEKNFKKIELKEESFYKTYRALLGEYKDKKLELENLKEKLSKISISSLENKLKEMIFIEKKHRLLENSLNSQYFVVLEGFILKEKLKKLEKILKNKIGDFLLSKVEFDTKKAPVFFKNKAIIKPYEYITKLFGIPNYTESDPTPFLMPFFTIYFGFALSESGYGIILFLLGIIFLFIKKLQTFSYLLMLSGISSILFGIILGTLFGIQVGFINSQKDPLYVLKVSFAFGLLHLALSFLIKFYNSFKVNKIKEGVKNGLMYFLILFTFFLYFAPKEIFNIEILSYKNLKNILLAELGIIFVLNIILEKNKIIGFLKNFTTLYSFVGIFSDILSYSRLLALGLATGVIASTVNLLAGILKGFVPIFPLNYIIFISVLFVGHTFNFLINILGAFIHSMRLQFVESFSKFFEGGGRLFKPLSKNYI